jgi:hypothetical protein
MSVSLSELKRSSEDDWKWMVVGCGLSDGGDDAVAIELRQPLSRM